MNKINTFDVLVVYTESVATSASSIQDGSDTPFSLTLTKKHYSEAYSYFLQACKKLDLRAAFTTSADIIGPGLCNSFWNYKNNKWLKVQENGFAPLIFDKVSLFRKDLEKKRNLLFSKDNVKSFSDIYLLDLFNDKLKTYKTLSNLTIPTVGITSTTIIQSVLELKNMTLNHISKNDFSKELILKDRFGSSGDDIYKINKNPIETIKKIMRDKPNVVFILQPFAKFKKGYSHNSSKGYIDIRIIYAQGKIVQRYIRTAKENDFRCNEHQGGKVIYVNEKAIPQRIKSVASEILRILNNEDALFALDFIVSNNGNVFLMEGNSYPGLDWNLSLRKNELKAKKFIRVIVKELKRRTERNYFETHNGTTLGNPALVPLLPPLKIPLVV